MKKNDMNKNNMHPSQIIKWPTSDAAKKHGWVSPRDAKRHLRPGLTVIDVSGCDSYGYDYAVVNINEPKRPIIQSKSIWLTDTQNKIGGMGAFTVMFHVTELRRAKPSTTAKIMAQKQKIERIEKELDVARTVLKEFQKATTQTA